MLLGDEPRRRDLLIEHLHKLQDHFGHISARHMVALAHEMKLSHTEVYEVASFYHHFDLVKEGEAPPPPLTVRVCDSVTCEMFGASELIATLEGELGAGVRVQRVPCVGRCEVAPVAAVGKKHFGPATLEEVKSRVEARDVEAGLPQGYVDLAEYRRQGGYQLLQACVRGERDREEVIETLERAELRGLGGAGFPVGRKWRSVRGQPAPKYVAVNIDEGEPGTFKDRYYMDSDPHRFFEGMLIGWWAVEAEDIYIYIRDEYPQMLRLFEHELEALRADPPCELPPIHLRRGAGAYICGEESGMVESIEGRRGMPRLRPPLVAQVGLWGRPTLENNCETLYWVRDVLERGPEWFASQGRRGYKGFRAFSVSGRVNKPGVHLAPAGITLRELVGEYCGGMQPGHELYGYFPGGASGGILPASMADEPLHFGTLEKHGCFIGAAAVIVLSDKDSARAAALNAMRFFAHESCGKCTPCRVGTEKSAALMEGSRWDVPLLEELAQAMVDASICGLGQAAPNPMRCVVKYFPQELE